MPQRKTLPAFIAAAGVGIALAVASPLSAAAHVSVTPNQADPGASQNFVFQALNESATASTVKVEVQLPTDTPLVSVRYQATPGWTTEVVTGPLPEPVELGGNTVTEAPTSIVFTADPGNGIRPGSFQTWTVSLGPIPETGQLLFPALQTYDDGEVANWTASADELEADPSLKPAPVIFVTDEVEADSHGHGSKDAESADEHEISTDAAVSTSAGPGSGLAVGLSIAALLLGGVGAVLGAVAVFGRRRA